MIIKEYWKVFHQSEDVLNPAERLAKVCRQGQLGTKFAPKKLLIIWDFPARSWIFEGDLGNWNVFRNEKTKKKDEDSENPKTKNLLSVHLLLAT
jgi:hypothetical protein